MYEAFSYYCMRPEAASALTHLFRRILSISSSDSTLRAIPTPTLLLPPLPPYAPVAAYAAAACPAVLPAGAAGAEALARRSAAEVLWQVAWL